MNASTSNTTARAADEVTRVPVEIRPLSPALLPDFLAYFEGDAFADNPKWGSCFCQFLYVDHRTVNWTERTAVENRSAACDRIRSGKMQGYLAYRDGKPVGWCNAAPRTMMAGFDDAPDPDAARIGQITCFVVAAPHRRSGVATALLQAACDGLKAQGFAIAEAMPLAEADTTDAKAHYGPLSMFLAAGFSVHRTEDDNVFVRRSLA